MSLIERWENDDEPEFIIRNGERFIFENGKLINERERNRQSANSVLAEKIGKPESEKTR